MSSAVSANRPTRCRREEGTAASELGATGLLSLWGSVSNCRDLANEDFLMGELADPDTDTQKHLLKTEVVLELDQKRACVLDRNPEEILTGAAGRKGK